MIANLFIILGAIVILFEVFKSNEIGIMDPETIRHKIITAIGGLLLIIGGLMK